MRFKSAILLLLIIAIGAILVWESPFGGFDFGSRANISLPGPSSNSIDGAKEGFKLSHLPHNIILIIVDTLSAKHLEGSSMESIAPSFVRLAARGMRFDRAYSAAPWTKPSIASVMTGVMPSVHGLHNLKSEIKSNLPMMAELFKDRGFKTAGFVSHTFLSPKTSFARGFENYRMVKFRGDVHDSITSDQVTDLGTKWLKKQFESNSNQNNFLFLHYFDPHFNYQHHPSFDRTSWYQGKLFAGIPFRELRQLVPKLNTDDVRYLEGLYSEEISYWDSQLGRLLDFLDETKKWEDTLVVLTADHGEEFLEHGSVGHGRTMYDEVIRVPLVLSLPGSAEASRITQPVSTISILPSLWALMDWEPLSNWTGQNLLSDSFGDSLSDSLNGSSKLNSDTLMCEVDFHASMLAAIQGDSKLILNKSNGKFQLFNLKNDPNELNNLYHSGVDSSSIASKLKKFRDEVQHGEADATGDAPSDASKEELQQLESLGYL